MLSTMPLAQRAGCRFYANQNLDMTVAFPIIATAPGIIGTLWGIFLFSEVSLKNSNIAMLVLAILFASKSGVGTGSGWVCYLVVCARGVAIASAEWGALLSWRCCR